MRLNIEYEYSFVFLRYMCRFSQGTPVTARRISQAEAYPAKYVQKILKRLRRHGIVASVRGSRGGYVLARSASEITLKQIIEALEGEVFRVYCEPPHIDRIICTHSCECSLRPVWKELRKVVDDFLQRVTLQTLLDSEEQVREELLQRKKPPHFVLLDDASVKTTSSVEVAHNLA